MRKDLPACEVRSIAAQRRVIAGGVVAGLVVGALALGVAAPASASPAPTTYTVSATIQIPVSNQFDEGANLIGVAVDSSTRTAYVADNASNKISVIDGATNTVTATVPAAYGPYGLAVDSSTHVVYVGNINDSSVSVIDGATNTVTATIPVPNGPAGVAVDSATGTVYVANYYANTVSVIDEVTNAVTAIIPVGSSPLWIAVDPSTHIAYVTNLQSDSVSVIDEATNTVTATVPVGRFPFGISVDPSTHTAYVANELSRTVSVIDGATNTVSTTVGVGSYPLGVGVDPSTHTVYVTGNDNGTVSIIDGTTNTVSSTLSVGYGPFGVGVDAITHTAYVANSSAGTVSVITASLPQAITFTSPAPSGATVGTTYQVAATGGGSGATVVFSADPASSEVCTVTSDGTVSFIGPGTCTIDADQAAGDGYTVAPTATQTVTVSKVATQVVVSSSVDSAVYGQPVTATATLTADSSAPSGNVQFAVDGTELGDPVVVSDGEAVSPALTDPTGQSLTPGAHDVTATFTPDDASTYAGSDGSLIQTIGKAGSTLGLVVHGDTITAAAGVVAPGTGTPTGTVVFTVGGLPVGTAVLSGGAATLDYAVPAGMTQHVAASYAGDANYDGSSASTSRRDPSITASVTSSSAESSFGWYRSAVVVTFTCVTHGAPLTTTCPSAVRLATNGAGRSITRSVTSTDGGIDTVVVRNINIDMTRPTVRVAGIRNLAVYGGSVPSARCVAGDALSGVVSCAITRHTSGSRTTYAATATDKAGNRRTVRGTYRTLAIWVAGAPFVNGAFNVTLGRTYTIIVHSLGRPTYYDAAPAPTTPFVRDQYFHAAGYHRWALGVTMTKSLRSHRYWDLGVKIGTTMHALRIRVAAS
jgi:YVTN family beta-propeller protein